jgi:hypothetical protein
MTMDTKQQERALQVNVAIGWIALALALMMIIISAIVKAAIETDFSQFVHHPGTQGWALFCGQFFVYVVLGVAASQHAAGWFRWVNAGLLAMVTLFMVLHQIGHMREGWVYGWTALVDATHHVVGLLATLQAIRWARLAAQANSRTLEQAAA